MAEKSLTYVFTKEVGKLAQFTMQVDTTEIQKGSTGSGVMVMQFLLKVLGYDLGSDGIDSVYGADTVAAVKAFQQKNGIKVDGICGMDTWAMLLGEGV